MADPAGSVLGTMDSGAARLMRSARAAGSAARHSGCCRSVGKAGRCRSTRSWLMPRGTVDAPSGAPFLWIIREYLKMPGTCGRMGSVPACAKILVEHAGGSVLGGRTRSCLLPSSPVNRGLAMCHSVGVVPDLGAIDCGLPNRQLASHHWFRRRRGVAVSRSRRADAARRLLWRRAKPIRRGRGRLHGATDTRSEKVCGLSAHKVFYGPGVVFNIRGVAVTPRE